MWCAPGVLWASDSSKRRSRDGARCTPDRRSKCAGIRFSSIPGRSLDIPFAIDAIARQPNTAAAHSLIGLAEVGAQQQQLVEALFQAYFLEGVDLTQRSELERLALGAGLAADAVAACLDSEEARDQVRASDVRARQMGVQGVPFFIFNNQVGVSGAHEPEVLLQAMEQARDHSSSA